MKNNDIIEKILQYHPQFPADYDGCDRYTYGDPQAECTGIATALVPTVDVIRRARDLGCNLLIVHEPLFYSGLDLEGWHAGFRSEVYEEKCALLDECGMTVWRDHDHMHAHQPDAIFAGVIKYMGWEPYLLTGEGDVSRLLGGCTFRLPPTTVRAAAEHLVEAIGMNGLRYIGNPDDLIQTVAVVGHLFPGFSSGEAPAGNSEAYGMEVIRAMEQLGVDAIMPGEIIEWTTLAYVRDAVDLGKCKAVFNVGHFNMEELGMKYAKDWIRELVGDALPVHYLPTGDQYRYV